MEERNMAVQIALPKTAEEFDRWVLLPGFQLPIRDIFPQATDP
jgi:hypothetical protein